MQPRDSHPLRRDTDRGRVPVEPFDPDSGLVTRELFRRRCDEAWQRGLEDGSPTTVVFVQIDYYTAYRDHRGKLATEAMLHRIAEMIAERSRRRADVAGRVRDDEFGLCLADTSVEGATALAQEIREGVDRMLMPHGGVDSPGHVTLSIGVASRVPRRHRLPSTVLVAADAALGRAREAGGNQVVVADSTD